MSNCVNLECRAVFQDDYAFCPYCGTDNRPPEDRPHIHRCSHAFIPGTDYCPLCGEPRDEPYKGINHKNRIVLGAVLVVIAVLLLAFGCACLYVVYKLPADVHSAFADWCRQGGNGIGRSWADRAPGENWGPVCTIAGAMLGYTGIKVLLGAPFESTYHRRRRGCFLIRFYDL